MRLFCTAAREGRLSTFLRSELQLSTGFIRSLKVREAIFVNGIARHTDYQVHPSDSIEVLVEEEPALYPAEPLPFEIVYEDAYFLIVDKPSNLMVHPSPNRMTGTLANRVVAYYAQTGQPYAFHPVTRLDRDTIGLVLIAKSAPIHERFVRLHKEGALNKRYRALVCGTPPTACGRIDAPIRRCAWPSLRREIAPDGQSAVTEYRVLTQTEDSALLELTPITGRTHQLRLHCCWSGFPILGDPQYRSEASETLSRQLQLTTQQLQAYSLSFPHPITGEPVEVHSRLKLPYYNLDSTT